MRTYDSRTYEGAYMAGVIAGKMTKTNTLGVVASVPIPEVPRRTWPPGIDVEHEIHGAGWVWGSGAGIVTVRFETANTPPGPVKSLRIDDPQLSRRAP